MCQENSFDADRSFGSHSLPSFTEKSEFKNAITYRVEWRKWAADTGSFKFQIYAQVFKIITWEEANTDTDTTTILGMEAEFVPKEYHDVSL